MTVDELRQVLSERIGRPVELLLSREGESVIELSDLYQPSPAGFGGRLCLRDGTAMTWELWLEDGDNWNFHTAPLAE
ncbi:MAG: hypothetical protein CL859_00930 [Cyanobium sp. ARS6]|uniref:hypothetical protein n=1 Tax=unclassified Synechococcus TaxID=2626047 RepID=UPI000C601599|nr:hypothetical protein [Cyanobium sp. ARS6]